VQAREGQGKRTRRKAVYRTDFLHFSAN